MEWSTLLIMGVVFALFLLVRRVGVISPAKARAAIIAGARVIDVRTPSEFQSQHLPGAINIPLNSLREQAPIQIPNRDEVLLLHCLSGGRSALGRRWLRQAGYHRVFNLGSYRRAARVLGTTKSPKA